MSGSKTIQTAKQTNTIQAGGTATLETEIGGTQSGAVHHVSTQNSGSASQTNSALNAAVGNGSSGGGGITVQSTTQSNFIDASGDATFRIVIEGDQRGAIHHINIGNIVDALQSNESIQFTASGGGSSLIIQATWQKNWLDASGDATLLITISGDHKGAIHHIDVGNNVTATQENSSVNYAVQGNGGKSVTAQGTKQSNVIDVSGDNELIIASDGDYKGAIHHKSVGNWVVSEQYNESVQVAVTGDEVLL